MKPYESIFLDQDALDAQAAQSSFHKRSHDNQDPPNNYGGENKNKHRKDVGEPSSRSSRRNRSLVVIIQDDTPIQKHSNPEWFPKKLGLAKSTKKFKKSDHKKDELTIANFKGPRLERLKVQYNNNVELEYHVSQLKAVVLSEAQWNTQKRSTLLLSLSIMLRDTTKKVLRIGSLKDVAKKFIAITLKLLMRSDDKEYEFGYADLPRLSVNDVEDMYLLQVQDKLHHLPLEFGKDFNNAFLSDGTLVKIQENLIDMLLKNKLGSGNKRLKGRDWTDYDVKSSREMFKKIDETLKHRQQLRRLE
ncbi:hypothetical protein Tco_1334826 [Tanacetum coccineum]